MLILKLFMTFIPIDLYKTRILNVLDNHQVLMGVIIYIHQKNEIMLNFHED